jgi:hypothetical protein
MKMGRKMRMRMRRSRGSSLPSVEQPLSLPRSENPQLITREPEFVDLTSDGRELWTMSMTRAREVCDREVTKAFGIEPGVLREQKHESATEARERIERTRRAIEASK